MSELGLWNIARSHPDLTALVGPDGQELSYQELTATADRYPSRTMCGCISVQAIRTAAAQAY